MKLRNAAIVVLLASVLACSRTPSVDAPVAADAVVLQSLSITSGATANGAQLQPVGIRDTLALTLQVSTAPPSAEAHVDAKFINLASGKVAATARVPLAGTTAQLTLQPNDGQQWEPGRYLVELSLDGRLLGSRDVDVSAPLPPG